MTLVQLIYSSTLVLDKPDVLVDILETARSINGIRNITGMLLHANGIILQVLEGAPEDVNLTFQSIERDARHRDVYVLSKQEIAARQFASWSMGFRELSAIDLGKSSAAAQVFNANRVEIANRVKPGAALALLAFFAQGVE